jgi:hypothetical protein
MHSFPPSLILIGRLNAFGVQGSDWSAHQLPSGKNFSEMLAHAIGWLNHQGYIAHPAAWVMLYRERVGRAQRDTAWIVSDGRILAWQPARPAKLVRDR